MNNTEFFFNKINEQNIQYCVAGISETILDVFVHKDDKDKFQQLMLSLGCKNVSSLFNKYSYIYKLIPDLYWEFSDKYIVHSACQMSCVSMSNLTKCKLPLDECIQKSMWLNKTWDSNCGYWKLSKEDNIIYNLTNCIFNKKEFDNESIISIQSVQIDWSSKDFVDKLTGVFFSFTPELINHIKANRFHDIIHDYRIFRLY